MNPIEYVGLCASAILIICVCVKSHTVKGNIIMRLLNALGSIIFVVYGLFLGAYSIVITNFVIFVISVYYILKLLFGGRKVDKHLQ